LAGRIDPAAQGPEIFRIAMVKSSEIARKMIPLL
jgi:hypothetical protein